MPNSRETIQSNTEFKKKLLSDVDFAEQLFQKGVLEGTKHSFPSPETLDRFEKLDHCLMDLTEAIHRLEAHSMDRAKKIDEMYDYFTRGGNIVWFIKWIFGSAATVGGLIVLYKSIINGQN